MVRRLAWGLTATLALGSVGCEREPTQLLVVVNTDLAVTAELDEVRILVWGGGRDPVEDRTVSLANDGARLPASFGVAPRGGDPGRRVRVAVHGRFAGADVVTTEARTGFLEHEILRLDLFLARGCRDVTCPEEETCRDGECAPVDVDPDDLPGWQDGEDLGPSPPDAAPAGWPILLPIEGGGLVQNLGMDVGPNGDVVVVGSFLGTLLLGDPITASREEGWKGFVARFDSEAAARYRTVVSSTASSALVWAVTVSPDDTTWVSSGCSMGRLQMDVIDGVRIFDEDCWPPERFDIPLDPASGVLPGQRAWAITGDTMTARVALDANADALFSAYWDAAVAGPTFARAQVGELIPQMCSIEGDIRPSAIAVDAAGALQLAASFSGAPAGLPLTSRGGLDMVFFSIPSFDQPCGVGSVFGVGSDGEEELLGLAVDGERVAWVGRWDGDGMVLATGEQQSTSVLGPGEERLVDVVPSGDGGWIAVGAMSPDASAGGAALTGKGSLDAVVLGLAGDLELVWSRVLGGIAGDEALAVELDPVTGDVLVLGLTTGPTDLDPTGRLLEGQRAIFVHRFPPPAAP